ncbi:hypothetical protein C8J57DRAFT_1235821 [Mycena rebaudengoi]|nr:hypothetical protein C8J57DRAFT_1235821 [Mycena rebaudengoi]
MTFHGGLNSLGTIRASLRVRVIASNFGLGLLLPGVWSSCGAQGRGEQRSTHIVRDCVCTTAHQQPAGNDKERGHEAQHGVQHELQGEHKQRGPQDEPRKVVASRAVLSVRVEAWGGLSSMDQAGGRAVVIPKEHKGGGNVSAGNQAAQAAGKDVGSGGGRAEEGGLQAGRARTSAAAMLWLLERVTRGFREPGLYLGAAWNEHEEQTTEEGPASVTRMNLAMRSIDLQSLNSMPCSGSALPGPYSLRDVGSITIRKKWLESGKIGGLIVVSGSGFERVQRGLNLEPNLRFRFGHFLNLNSNFVFSSVRFSTGKLNKRDLWEEEEEEDVLPEHWPKLFI